MSSGVQVLNVFIASPSDVADERDATERVVAKVNQAFAPLNWIVRPFRWENSRRGLGTAQSLINRDVDDCDLLIGILHSRIGTPTEEFASGFEEEVERFRARKSDGEPAEAVLFLRDLRANERRQQGIQSFRKRIMSIAFCHRYRDVIDFENQLFEALTREIADRAAIEHASERPPGLPAGAAPPKQLVPSEGEPANSARTQAGAQQAAEALRALSAHVAGAEDEIEQNTIVRAHLAATAILNGRLTGAVLDVHQINRVYVQRDELELSRQELMVVGRTMCEHGLLAPGWGLLGEETRAGNLVAIAVSDDAPSVRVGALRELGAAGLRAGADELLKDFDDRLEVLDLYVYLATSEDVQEAVAPLLPESGIEHVDYLLALIAADGDIGAHRLLVNRLIDTDPTAAAELVAESPTWLEADSLERLLDRAMDVGSEGLAALEEAGTRGKKIALRLRARSGRLDTAAMIGVLRDGKTAARRDAFEALLDSGTLIPIELVDPALRADKNDFLFDSGRREQLAVRALAAHPLDDLLESVTWIDSDSGRALQAAARRADGDAALHRARTVLDGGLDGERAAAIKRDVASSSDQAKAQEKAAALVERFGEFLDSQLVIHALRALAERPDPQLDPPLARQHVTGDNPFARSAAAQILAACARPEDVSLLARALDLVLDERDDVLRGLLAATGGDADAALEAVETGAEHPDRHIPSLLRFARQDGLRIVDTRLIELLLHEADDVRRAAAASLATQQSREELERTLADYVGSDRYRYYDVIGIFDRVLHGPKEIAAETLRRLS